jgi:hypothetical protein
MKENSQGKINELLEVNEEISCGELASIILSSLQCEKIAPSVRKSFKHTGVFPRNFSFQTSSDVSDFKRLLGEGSYQGR